MILCTGIRTTIIEAISQLRPEEMVTRIEKRSDEIYDFTSAPPGCRIVLAAGYLAGLADHEHTPATREQTIEANFLQPLNISEQALADIPGVRICVIGSQSAVAGSHDTQYANAKALLHRWVLRQRVQPPQQLLCVAPPIISDSAMTRRRHDYPRVLKERATCTAADVARLIVEHLYEREPNPGVNSNTVLFVPTTCNGSDA